MRRNAERIRRLDEDGVSFHIVIEVEDERGLRRAYSFEQSPIRIGRNALNEVVVESSFVSQWHGALHVGDNIITYVDLGSTNGTAILGRRVPKNTPTQIHVDGKTPIMLGRISVFVRPAHPGEAVHGPMLARDSSFDAPTVGRRATMVAPPISAAGTELLPTNQKKALDDALNAVERVRLPYEAYRASREELMMHVRTRLEGLPASMRAPTLRHILRELPEIGRQPELFEVMDSLDIPRDAANIFDAEAWLARLVPEAAHAVGRAQINVPVAMERVGAALEAFAQAFVELRNGKTAFCDEMGLSAGATPSALGRSASGRTVLTHVLDWDAEGLDRLTELRRAFADLAMHQVAVVAGVAEGGRELLGEVSPRSDSVALARASWLARLLPVARLGALRRRHEALLAEDGFTRVLFGNAFTRAYYTVLGKEQ